MRKKYILLLIAVFLLSLLMVACGGEQAEPATTDDQDATTEDATGTDDTEADDTEDDAEADSGDAQRAVTVRADTVNSHTVEHAVCVVNSRFEQGWGVVFRASVLDSESENVIEDADVKVVFENGDELEMQLGEHGDNDTLLYTVMWMIPEDFPTGTLGYEIVANVDGVDYVYEPFDVEPSKFTVIEPTEEG